MTTALYRRYRPETFAEVIGQEHVTAPLMQALRSGRVNHAYLFSGPRGCGKTTSARILARTLNCHRNTPEHPIDTPCGECPSCVELARGGSGSLDVVEIDAASHGGVDDARDLRERATFAPTRDRYKIFVIDEAHMVSPAGFNALLKIVEEPPPHIKFVFATTEPDKVIGTIRSRTHHYPFRLLPPDVLGPYLEQLCTAEGVELGPGVTPLVTRAGGGSARDTLSVLDQLIAGATGKVVEYDTAVGLLGFTHATLLDDVVDAIAARDGGSIFRVVDHVVATGHEPRRFVEDVLERLRDLIVIAVSGDAAGAVLRDLPADQLDRMRHQAANLGVAELSRAADLVNDALTEMAGATSPRLHLELLCARLLLPGADDGTQGLAARLDRLERGAVAAGPVAPAGQAPVATVPAAAPGAGAPVAAVQAPAGTPSVTSDAGFAPSAPGGLSGAAAARAALLASRRSGSSAGSAGSAAEVPAPAPAVPAGPAAEVPAPAVPAGPADSSAAVPEPLHSGGDTIDTPAVVPAPSTGETDAAAAAEPATGTTPPVEAFDPAGSVASPDPVDPGDVVDPAGAADPGAEPDAGGSAAAAGAAPTAPPGAPPAPAEASADANPGTPVATVTAPGAGDMTAEEVRRRWDEVVGNLSSPVTRALVDQNAQVASLAGDRLLLAFQTEPLARTFSQPRHLEAFGDALYQTLGLRVQLDVTVGAPGPADAPAAAGRGATPPAPAGRPSAGPGDGPAAPPAARPSGSSGPAAAPRDAHAARPNGSDAARGREPGTTAANDVPPAEEPPGDDAGDPWPDVPPSDEVPASAAAADAAWLAGTPARVTPGPEQVASASAPGARPSAAAPAAADAAGSSSAPAAPAADTASSASASTASAATAAPAAPAAFTGAAAAARAAARPTVSGAPADRAPQRTPEPAEPDRGYVDGYDDVSDDDPDIASTGLVGVPLVVKMLDGRVIDEVVDQP